MVFEDDGFQPKNTVSAFNKLVNTDGADVIICFASGPCNAIAPIADQKQIPLIAVASAPVQKDREFVVRLEISTVEEAKKLSKLSDNEFKVSLGVLKNKALIKNKPCC